MPGARSWGRVRDLVESGQWERNLHTPSSNAPRSPALVAAIVNNVGGTDGLERVVRPDSPWCA